MKDDNVGKVQMTRSHDTWVLLLVVSVLSTLLSVIVISTCLWICFKYCIHPSTFKRRQCVSGCQQIFPPLPRERINMGEFGGCVNFIKDQRGTSVFPHDKTGTSEQLGYGPNVNVSVPVVPTPRSWTPSPPFAPAIHQRSLPNIFTGCHDGSQHHCCNVLTHEDCFSVEKKVPSPCHICPNDLRDRLTHLQRYSRENPRKSLAHCSETNRSAYRPPVNTPKARSKERYGTSISQGYEASSDETQRRVNTKRKSTSNNFNHFGKSLSHSVASRNKESNSYGKGTYKESYAANKAKKSDGTNTDKQTSSGKLHSPFRLFSLGRGNSYSSATLPGERLLEKLKRQNTVATFLESSSNSSSDGASALNRTSRTFWKLIQPTEEDEMKQNGEEEARYDAAQSLSWDHLTPEPLPIPEIPKVEIDPAKATATYYHDKRTNQDGSDRENIQINDASNPPQT